MLTNQLGLVTHARSWMIRSLGSELRISIWT